MIGVGFAVVVFAAVKRACRFTAVGSASVQSENDETPLIVAVVLVGVPAGVSVDKTPLDFLIN
jgi:hypothetical protein